MWRGRSSGLAQPELPGINHAMGSLVSLGARGRKEEVALFSKIGRVYHHSLLLFLRLEMKPEISL